MAVSATGTRSLSMAKIKTVTVVAGALAGLGFYLYGPPLTPVMQASAVSKCNELTGGSFRSYDLAWVVGTNPHWVCANRFDPAQDPMDMGWWVTPGN